MGTLAEFEAITKEVRALLLQFLSPSAKELGEWLGEEIGRARQRRALRVLERAREKLIAEGARPEPVPERILLPSIEYSSLLEDEEENLREMWATLIASSSRGAKVHPSYPEVLRQLTTIEARVLEALVGYGWNSPRVEVVQQNVGCTFADFTIVKDNLHRLGLIRAGFEFSKQPSVHGFLADDSRPDQPVFGETNSIHAAKTIRLTPFGEGFMAVCSGSESPTKEKVTSGSEDR